MKNKKLLTWLLLTTVVVGWIWATFASDSTKSWITNANKEFRKINNLNAEQKAEMEAIKTIMQKKKNGETLTVDEQAKLTAFEANKPNWKGIWMGMWMGMLMGKWHWDRWWEMRERGFENNLTDAEKTALKTMTNAEKQTFFETKMTTQKAKMEAYENVIDKLLAWVTLTSEEEAIKQEIIKQRAERKAKMVEMETKMTEIKAILEKKKSGETLTSDEQAKLDTFKSERHWKGMRKMMN